MVMKAPARRAGGGAAFLGGAATGAASTLIIERLLKATPVQASGEPVPVNVILDADTRQALAQIILISQGIQDELSSLNIGGSSYPANTNDFVTDAILLDRAGYGYQLPSIPVPDGMTAVIKSDPDNALASRIYVARTKGRAEKLLPFSQAWKLIPGGDVGWRISNLGLVWVATNIAPVLVSYTIEQRGQ